MAFQRDNVFSDFLRQTARNPDVSESAPAVNFLLDERVAEQRETVFLAGGPMATGSRWDSNSLKRTFGNHFAAHIGVSANNAKRCDTFDAINQPNHLASTESNQDVVRLESVAGFYDRAKAGFDSLDKFVAALRYFTSNRNEMIGDGVIDPDKKNKKSQLETWVDELNRKRDARPMFVAPFGEVESLLKLSDWPTRLRNMLGLVHHNGTPDKPLPVVLMRYSLSRAEQASRKLKMNGWAAVPTP